MLTCSSIHSPALLQIRGRADELCCCCCSVATAKLILLSWPRFPSPFSSTSLFILLHLQAASHRHSQHPLVNPEYPNHCKTTLQTPVRHSMAEAGKATGKEQKPSSCSRQETGCVQTQMECIFNTRQDAYGDRALHRENWK